MSSMGMCGLRNWGTDDTSSFCPFAREAEEWSDSGGGVDGEREWGEALGKMGCGKLSKLKNCPMSCSGSPEKYSSKTNLLV